VTADRLLLWRHGRTASNAGDRFQGQLDVPLDDVGRVQIKDSAEMLAGLLAGKRCRIVSSDLSRAHQTALALSELIRVPVTTDPQLREIFVKSWQGLKRRDIQVAEPELFARWRSGEDVAVGGGERRSEAGLRAAEAIRRHAADQDGGVLVVASHGAALRGAVMLLIGLAEWSPGLLGGMRNAHWAELRRRAHQWVLEGYNVGPPQGSVGPEG
jgi:probable phosphoglycerate mutase